jgi:hypothetical protein
MKTNTMRLILWIIHILLGALVVFWLVLGVKLTSLYFMDGAVRVRSYLIEISNNYLFLPDVHPDAVQRVETTYRALLLLFAMTWVLRELRGLVHWRLRVRERRVASISTSDK